MERKKHYVDHWLKFFFGTKREDEKYDWVIPYEYELIRNKPFEMLDLIVAVYTRDCSLKVLPVLAAGPLEDLIKLDDDAVLTEIIEIAKKDRIMQFLLGGVWFSYSPLNPLHKQILKYSLEMNEENYYKYIDCGNINKD